MNFTNTFRYAVCLLLGSSIAIILFAGISVPIISMNSSIYAEDQSMSFNTYPAENSFHRFDEGIPTSGILPDWNQFSQ